MEVKVVISFCIALVAWLISAGIALKLSKKNEELREKNAALTEALELMRDVMDDKTCFVNMDILLKEINQYLDDLKVMEDEIEGSVEKIFWQERKIVALHFKAKLLQLIKEHERNKGE